MARVLSGKTQVSEAESVKEEASLRSLWADGSAEAATIEVAVAAWKETTNPLPSLADAYEKAKRVGLT